MCLIVEQNITAQCASFSRTQYCTINDKSECHVTYTESLHSSCSKPLFVIMKLTPYKSLSSVVN